MLLSILHVRHSPNTGLSYYLAQNVTSVQVEEPGLRASSGPGTGSLPPLGHQMLI